MTTMKTIIVVASFSLIGIGCSGDGASGSRAVESVAGVVMLDGSPLEGAEIKLISQNSSGFGKTGPGGKYQLVQGVPAGSYKVVISKIEGGVKPGAITPKPGEEQLDAGQFAAIAAAEQSDPTKAKRPGSSDAKETIPADYSHPGMTKLALEVPKGGLKDADFKITSK